MENRTNDQLIKVNYHKYFRIGVIINSKALYKQRKKYRFNVITKFKIKNIH